ncbi:MAG: VWA domain-containing protein [Candidatus Latescibacteria bacterium]|jgi:hypothetical protein|nr:VWA domain-containing protein [Candidatus Latescibacterota bacterium]MBT5829295.1 VWA domain-containing protein [Candidatus Latescibacterota bacterium]
MFGLSFTNPAMLYGLWAALLPLVIHLLNRRRSVTLPFSNVALLQTLQHDRMRRVKLKQIILLILRTLLIVLLVLAFARPTLTGAGASGSVGDAGTAAVILVDQSLSMQYRTPQGTLFERSKARVRDILSLFNAQDDVQILLVDSDVTPLSDASLTTLRARIDGWSAQFDVTDMLPGLQTALTHLQTSQMPNKELYVVSDVSHVGWASVPDTLEWDGISVFVVPERPEIVQNVSVAQVKTVGGLLRVGQPVTLEIELVNHSETPRGDVPLQAFWDDRRIIQQVAHIPAKGHKKLYARFTPETSGARALRVEIGDDDLPADNTRVSVVQVPEQLRVLVIGDTRQDTYFLSQALQAASFDVHIQSSDQVTDEILSAADVVYLCHVSRLSAGIINRLQKHVSSGGGLGIVLGEQVDMRHYNERILSELLPATLISVRGQPGATTAYQAFPPELPNHPMLSHVQLDGTFRSPRFFAHYVVRPEGETQAILSFANGTPALLESKVGQGHVVLFVSEWGATLSWNDMPVSGFFLPFVYNLTGYLVSGAVSQSDYMVGRVVNRPLGISTKNEGVLRSPGNDAQTIWPQQRGVSPIWPVGRVDRPGLWKIYAQERLADLFAVQVDPMASDLTRVSDARLQAIFGDTRLFVVSADQQIKDVVLPLRYGREFWRLALAGALFLMFVEMWIAKTTRSRRL